MISGEYDVVVVGAGNAGMCAALAAQENGARVLVLEAAPFDERGGNSRYTAGALRFVYNGVDDLLKLCDLSPTEIATSDFGTYTQDKYYDDLGRLTDYRSNPDMAELLITRSQDTLLWMRGKGVRFAPMYARQAFKHDGKFVFWGGLALEAWGGGPGLVEGLFNALEKNGIDVAYEARGEKLIADDDGVHGVVANVEGKTTTIPCKGVVLACGGFEANAEMRTRYLGPGWDLAKVRGTRFNTGDQNAAARQTVHRDPPQKPAAWPEGCGIGRAPWWCPPPTSSYRARGRTERPPQRRQTLRRAASLSRPRRSRAARTAASARR